MLLVIVFSLRQLNCLEFRIITVFKLQMNFFQLN